MTGPDSPRLRAGTWGGEHVALTVTDAGARVEFDCAHGEIRTPVAVDAAGHLAVAGVYVQEQGGPVRLGEEPEEKPARYTGRLTGDTLTFEVILTESKQTVGSFTAVHGVAPRLRKCR